MMMRYLSIFFLLMSGIAGYTIDKFGQDLCLSDYIAVGTITYFKELQGVSANDPSMLSICGIFSIIFSIILILIKNKYLYLTVIIILFILEFILMHMIETASYTEILYDSITKCSNLSILGWVVGQLIGLIGSICYIFKNNE
ncbi:hypothetical protein F993_03493 [Acinetobacter proteolyticus]|uniref:Uncharacterized protein n=1 Tax=Acinetobacter proteolyticus TaxID=1776741 RepID=A0ABP2TGU8_9GAMM|nr:hypothetical protein F993_03493 [Acinetobacter proteolyticus]